MRKTLLFIVIKFENKSTKTIIHRFNGKTFGNEHGHLDHRTIEIIIINGWVKFYSVKEK